MKYIYQKISLELYPERVSLGLTRDGTILLQGELRHAHSSDSTARSVEWNKSPMMLLGALMEDIPASEVEEFSRVLGNLRADEAREILEALWWEGEVEITRTPGGE